MPAERSELRARRRIVSLGRIAPNAKERKQRLVLRAGRERSPHLPRAARGAARPRASRTAETHCAATRWRALRRGMHPPRSAPREVEREFRHRRLRSARSPELPVVETPAPKVPGCVPPRWRRGAPPVEEGARHRPVRPSPSSSAFPPPQRLRKCARCHSRSCPRGPMIEPARRGFVVVFVRFQRLFQGREQLRREHRLDLVLRRRDDGVGVSVRLRALLGGRKEFLELVAHRLGLSRPAVHRRAARRRRLGRHSGRP